MGALVVLVMVLVDGDEVAVLVLAVVELVRRVVSPQVIVGLVLGLSAEITEATLDHSLGCHIVFA